MPATVTLDDNTQARVDALRYNLAKRSQKALSNFADLKARVESRAFGTSERLLESALDAI